MLFWRGVTPSSLRAGVKFHAPTQSFFKLGNLKTLTIIAGKKFTICGKLLEALTATTLNFLGFSESTSTCLLEVVGALNSDVLNSQLRGESIPKNKASALEYLRQLIFLKDAFEILGPFERFYLPLFFDFRGRLYYGGVISPTTSTIARFSLYGGYYAEEVLSELDPLVETLTADISKTHLREILQIFDSTRLSAARCWIAISFASLRRVVNAASSNISLRDLLLGGAEALSSGGGLSGAAPLSTLLESAALRFI